MAYETDLAKEFKKRDNEKPIGNIVGRVVAGLPDIKISILDDNVILGKDKLYCCNSLLNHDKQASIQLTASTDTQQGHSHSIIINTDCNLTFSIGLNIGDLVLLQHSSDGTKWFIVDKITKL